jgi:hypothetical protein
MAVSSHLVKPSLGSRIPAAEELGQHHEGTIEMKRSCANVETAVSDDKFSCLNEDVNERWTACGTPSCTNETGGTPAAQRPMHSTTHNKYLSGLQMAADSHQALWNLQSRKPIPHFTPLNNVNSYIYGIVFMY